MADRQRVRVGREGAYYPTDAEAATGGGASGDAWSARIVNVNLDGTVNLAVFEADGTMLAKTSVSQGNSPGTFSLHDLTA